MNFSRGLSNLFRSSAPVANRLFQQAKNFATNTYNNRQNIANQASDLANKARGATGDISAGLGKAGHLLNQVSQISGEIANNPTAMRVAQSSPTLSKGLGAVRQGSQFAGKASELSNNLAHLSNERNYTGTHGQNVGNALERAQQTQQQASLPFR